MITTTTAIQRSDGKKVLVVSGEPDVIPEAIWDKALKGGYAKVATVPAAATWLAEATDWEPPGHAAMLMDGRQLTALLRTLQKAAREPGCPAEVFSLLNTVAAAAASANTPL